MINLLKLQSYFSTLNWFITMLLSRLTQTSPFLCCRWSKKGKGCTTYRDKSSHSRWLCWRSRKVAMCWAAKSDTNKTIYCKSLLFRQLQIQIIITFCFLFLFCWGNEEVAIMFKHWGVAENKRRWGVSSLLRSPQQKREMLLSRQSAEEPAEGWGVGGTKFK